ncbi:MAG: polyribonucleotide nucleotidyltransferase [Phycisphaerae bacterium]
MPVVRVEREIAGRTLSIETGKIAKQAHGSAVVQYGDTVVLVTVLSAAPQRDLDFFPLFVDYRENRYAAGKIPGGFFKREGRPSTKEILTMRMIDRPIRPLFPKDFRNEVQIQCMVLSADNENDPDLFAMIGASAALSISPAPFAGPIGAAKMGYVDGEFVLNPTQSQLDQSGFEMLACGPREAINMIEFDGEEVPEDIVAEGLDRCYKASLEVIEMIDEFVEKVGPEKMEYEEKQVPADLMDHVSSTYGDRIKEAKQIAGKTERGEKMGEIRQELLAEFAVDEDSDEEPKYEPWALKEAFYLTEGKIQRQLILGGTRPDGRKADEVRDLGVEVGVLPRTHGSALFNRGETMAMVTATLGTPRDEQIIDGLQEEYKKKFMLHYNFPPFSVGEIRPIRGPGRREIGHGALAEKSLQPVMPSPQDFPYTVRLVADIMESNGSTSQAAVTGGTLALMDAGVPIAAPVAGISIGMVSDGDDYVLLTDILGEEDFHGDMDFKVAGTRNGITGIQLDMKARGIPQDRIVETLQQAKQARFVMLDKIEEAIPAPREVLSDFAPRMLTITIDTDKIGKIIGPGGKMINKIQEETGASIDIEDDGTIFIASVDGGGAEAAKAMIQALTQEPEVGTVYQGKVVSIMDFGAFVEILPGQDGLVHVSELSDEYVKNVADVVNVGDEMKVKCISIDQQGRVKLSRKAIILEERGEEYTPSQSGGRSSKGGKPRRRGGGSGGGGGRKRD